MHTLTQPLFSIRIAACLAALHHALAEALRRRKLRALARRAARAFEHLDDRTLRDLGFHCADAGAIGAEWHAQRDAIMRRVIHAI